MFVVNKSGKTLKRKGQQTRERLLDAAETLLKSESPVELTAIAIARDAGTVSSTFYIYFGDLKDLFYALAERAAKDMSEVLSVLREPIADAPHFAQRVVQAFSIIWQSHSEVLRIRNLEADRGDPRFLALREETAIPIITAMCDRVMERYPEGARPQRRRINARCVSLYLAMETLAGTHKSSAEKGGGTELLLLGQADIFALLLRAEANPGPDNAC